MRQKSGQSESSSERLVKDIRRATRKQYSAEEKIRVVLDGLRGEHSIAELCRRLSIPWSERPVSERTARFAGLVCEGTWSLFSLAGEPPMTEA